MNELANLAGPTRINMQGQFGIAQYGSDDQLLVMFYNRPVENPALSLEHGRPYYEDKIYIIIQTPGEGLNKIDRPVADADKHRFANKWAAFVQNRTQVPEGTPIDLLFPNYPAVAENLRGYGIYTIEQCSKLSASAIDNIGRGGQEYVNRANQYLENAKSGKAFLQLRQENDNLRNEVEVQKHQIGQLKSQLDHIMMKFNDPLKASQQPPFIIGHDAQAERINLNHPTAEAAKKVTKKRTYTTPEDAITDPLAKSGVDATS
jgi:hypothetical protein